MDLQPREEYEHHEHKDRRIWFGLAATFIWVLLGINYISNNIGWSSFATLPIDEMGSFLEGAFAPLAFLWLVIGLFIQQTVLAENNRSCAAPTCNLKSRLRPSPPRIECPPGDVLQDRGEHPQTAGRHQRPVIYFQSGSGRGWQLFTGRAQRILEAVRQW